MKPKNPKQTPPLHQIHLELTPDNSAEIHQVLTFDTVDELLSYDRHETEVPERVVRKLRVAFPGKEIKSLRPKSAQPWQPPRAKG